MKNPKTTKDTENPELTLPPADLPGLPAGSMTFDVNGLLDTIVGSTEKHSFEVGELKGEIEIMRIEKGLNVRILHATTKQELECEKCLNSFIQEIQLEPTERQFFIKQPKNISDPFDIHLVDMKNQKIDATELFRQEIILHFPTILVCSTGCKGICDKCGRNRNTEKCECKSEEDHGHKPLSALKELLN